MASFPQASPPTPCAHGLTNLKSSYLILMLCVSPSSWNSSLVSVSYESPVRLERRSPSTSCVWEIPEYVLFYRDKLRAPRCGHPWSVRPPRCAHRWVRPDAVITRHISVNSRSEIARCRQVQPFFPLRMISDKNVGVPTVHVWGSSNCARLGEFQLYTSGRVPTVRVWMWRRLFMSGGHSLYDFAQAVKENGGCVILRPEF